jgi:hypothetical protein
MDAPSKPKPNSKLAYSPANGFNARATSLAVSIGILLAKRVAAVETIIKKAINPVKKVPINTSQRV